MPDNPYAQFNFVVTIGNLPVGGFTEISGITMESDVIEYREGRDLSRVRKIPALTKFGPITLKRGYTKNDALWLWRKTTLDGATVRYNGTIELQDERHEKAVQWNFYEAWISKYEGPSLNATTNEAAIESIDLAAEYVERVV